MATQHEQVMAALLGLAESGTRTNTLLERLVEKLDTQAPAKKSQAGKAATTSKAAKTPAKEKALTREDIAHKAVACKRADRKAPPEGKVAWAEEREGGVFIFARTLDMAARSLGTLPKTLVVEQFKSAHPYRQTSTWWVKSGSLAQAQDFAKKVR